MVAGTIYFLVILVQAASFEREWLVSDLSAFQNATYGTRYIVVAGILIASYSSALGAIFGLAFSWPWRITRPGRRVAPDAGHCARPAVPAPRRVWLRHTQRRRTPRRGGADVHASVLEPMRPQILTWAIAQCCLFVGSLDVIAPVISAFFCLAYGLVNLTCLLLTLTGARHAQPTQHSPAQACPTSARHSSGSRRGRPPLVSRRSPRRH